MHTKVKELRSQMTDPPRLRLVLLVDDYPDAREMYSEYLKFSGFDVVETTALRPCSARLRHRPTSS